MNKFEIEQLYKVIDILKYSNNGLGNGNAIKIIEEIINKSKADNFDEILKDYLSNRQIELIKPRINSILFNEVNNESNRVLNELLDWTEISLSAESKLGASDDVIKSLLNVKYKIESILKSNIYIKNDLDALDIYMNSSSSINNSNEDNINEKKTIDKDKGVLSIPKSALKMDINQRMIMIFHEFAHKVRNENSKYEVKINHAEENKKYFENFPFDEQAVRDFLKCKQELGGFSDCDVYNDKLITMLNYPNDRYGFRILNVTVGKGTHVKEWHGYKEREYQVKENEVYITYNDMYNLCGGIYTCVMTRIDGKNKIIKSYCHARS